MSENEDREFDRYLENLDDAARSVNGRLVNIAERDRTAVISGIGFYIAAYSAAETAERADDVQPKIGKVLEAARAYRDALADLSEHLR